MDKESLIFEGIIRKLNIDETDDKIIEQNKYYIQGAYFIITTLPPSNLYFCQP